MHDGTPRDLDPDETQEWKESIDAVVDVEGPARAQALLEETVRHAAARGVPWPDLRSAPYVNTIPVAQQPPYPGDAAIEERITAYLRWNAAVMVTRANSGDLGVGGHISTYASAAVLYEVAFQHFFRGKDDGPGDQIFFQGHAAPGIYARAYLEGRIDADQLDFFRQETRTTQAGKPGLSSYPHPRLMPSFWEFPTVSMGLGPLGAIYQARFNRYLHHRGIADTSKSRVWCFLGDGEMDEVESTGAIGLAARENLDNLVFVLNCNLQRLDGPVRGNGKIVTEMEGVFRGAGWNIVKVLWGEAWDDVLARAPHLVARLAATPDGQMQTIAAESAAYAREKLFADVDGLSDEDVATLARSRGGHEAPKVHAAYANAVATRGRPTIVLAQTIKGFGLGPGFESRNATHQMKKVAKEGLHELRDRLQLPITDEEIASGHPPYVKPKEGSPEHEYLHARRRALGGYVPTRVVREKKIAPPPDAAYAEVAKGSGGREVSTTTAFVALLRELVKSEESGRRLVPIIPDEARTFGMDAFFPSLKIYSPHGQRYDAVDRASMLKYVESTEGQILHEGISEAGSMASFCAAGTSYATFGEPVIPVYVFYSMFGFQRTGDSAWQAADQRARGFLIGATAGRTTLNGEGLQHEDGHSPLLAATNPACRVYDPAFGYEIGAIVKDGLKKMLQDDEDVFYYLTVYNEPIAQPAQPAGFDADAAVRGLYLFDPAARGKKLRAQLLASGSAMKEAQKAKAMLEADHDVGVDLWSVTSWVELRRDAERCEERALFSTGETEAPYVARALADAPGPVVAVSDYMKALPDLLRPYVKSRFVTLGTDGFGRSDSRPALRRLFKIDAASIAVATLAALARDGKVKADVVTKAIAQHGIDPSSTTALP